MDALEVLDYICISIMEVKKSSLLNEDYQGCLMLLITDKK